MNLAEDAYAMPTGMLLHEAGRQFTMAGLVRDGWQQWLYERGGWFLLLVHAERTYPVLEKCGKCRNPWLCDDRGECMDKAASAWAPGDPLAPIAGVPQRVAGADLQRNEGGA